MESAFNSRRDASLLEIRSYCDKWQVQTFERFKQNILVNQAYDPPLGIEKKGWFWISMGAQEKLKRFYRINTEHIYLRSKEKWVSLDCYLERLTMTQPDPTPIYSQEALCRKQWVWWQKNDQKFPFMGLPAEIREIVYEHVFTRETDLHLEDVRLHPKIPWLRRRPFLQATCDWHGIGILFLSRQVFEEASHIFYRNVNFVVESMHVLKLLQQCVTFSHIRNLTIDLTHFDYLRLFGLTTEEQLAMFGDGQTYDSIPHESPAVAKTLRTLDLHILRLNVRTPYSMSCDERLKNAHHNDLVSTVLTKAWPCVKGQPVTLSGSVDDVRVLLFRANVDVARKQYDDWNLEQQRWSSVPTNFADYLEWVEDDDGGVQVDGQDRISVSSNELQLLEKMIAKHEGMLSEKAAAGTLTQIDDDEPK